MVSPDFIVRWIGIKHPKLAIILFGFILSFFIYVLVSGIFLFDWIIGISVAVLFFVVFVILVYKLVLEKRKKSEIESLTK